MAYDPQTGLDTVEQALQDSPTAYNNAAAPTSSDLSADRKRMALEKSIASAGNKRLQERWYGTVDNAKAADIGQPPTPFLEKTLNALTAPLKATVGVAQYARNAAQGTPTGSLAQTVNKNLAPEGETWGGFLQSVNVPHIVSAPLGFMMDIALDPVNVMTMGTSSLLGKTAYGLKTAGLEGAGLAVGEEASRFGYNVLKRVPGLSALKNAEGQAAVEAGAWARSLPKDAAARVAWEQSAPAGLKARAFVQSLGDTAVAAGKKYDVVTGRSLPNILAKEAASGPLGLSFRPSVKVEQYFRDKGFGGAIDALKYSPQTWADQMKLVEYQDALDRAAGKLISVNVRTPEGLAEAKGALDRLGGVPMSAEVPQTLQEAVHALDATPPEAKSLVAQMAAMANDGAAIMQDVDYLKPETIAKMEDFIAKSGVDRQGIDAIKKTMEEMRAMGKNPTGWKAYDETIAKLGETFKIKYKDKVIPVGQKVLNFMDLTHRIFALMKVPLSPSAWANAVGGNLVMAHLSGVNVLDAKFYSSLNGAWDVAKGKVNEDFFKAMEPYLQSIEDTTAAMPTYAHKTLGFDPRYMQNMQHNLAADEAIKMAAKDGVKLTHEEVIQAIADAKGSLPTKAAATPEEAALAAESEMAKRARAATQEAPKTAVELQQMVARGEGDMKLSDLPGNFVTDEIMGGTMAPILNKLKEASKTSNAAKYMYAAATKPGSWYSQIDSIYKLGTWHHLVTNGLTESELRLLNRFIPVGESITGTIKDGANLRYTISPEKALDAVNEIYMQYAAMPTAVNVLRSLPIIGSPFIAFPYAMTTKVAKAMAYNPAAFNKVAFAMSEVSGRKGPLEKQALEGKYYQHLNQPGYLRVQFFKDNPLYLNLTNMIPYYSLNQLAPSERSFKNTWANGIAQAVDSSPFFKGPWGQTLIDDVVIPSFLNGEEPPQGYFGQTIWPKDATATEKAGYAARGVGEAFLPGALGVAGIAGAPFPALADPSVVEKIPLSKLRTMLYATQGKSSIGVQTRETPWEKVQRTMAGQLGIPVTPVETQYSSKK